MDALSRFPINRTDNRKLHDKILVLSINQEAVKVLYDVEIKQDEQSTEYNTQHKDFAPCLSKDFALADKVQKTKVDTMDLHNFLQG